MESYSFLDPKAFPTLTPLSGSYVTVIKQAKYMPKEMYFCNLLLLRLLAYYRPSGNHALTQNKHTLFIHF